MARPLQVCERQSGQVLDGTDCDDTDAGSHPGAFESCDGSDNDCDGEADEGPWPAERCNGLDDDCDGLIDDDDVVEDGPLWYPDADRDGAHSSTAPIVACDPGPQWSTTPGTDCDDFNPEIYRDAVETCDTLDNDCDGLIDGEDSDLIGLPGIYWDVDGDGYGDQPVAQACPPLLDDQTLEPGDCMDRDPTVHPGAPERCNGRDDDCDGAIDEDLVSCADAREAVHIAGQPPAGPDALTVLDGLGDDTPDLWLLSSLRGLEVHTGPLVEDVVGGAQLVPAAATSRIAVGDLTGDSRADVLVSSGRRLSWYTGDALALTGTLEGEGASSEPFGASVWFGGDTDDDGDIEVAILDPGHPTLDGAGAVWLFSDPAGPDPLTASVLITHATAGDDPQLARLGEVMDGDGDGVPELLLSGRPAGSTTLALHHFMDPWFEGGDLADADATLTNLPDTAHHLADAGDIDGDGTPELAVFTGTAAGVVFISTRAASGALDDATLARVPGDVVRGDVASLDDALALGTNDPYSGRVWVLPLPLSGTIEADDAAAWTWTGLNIGRALESGDIDGDGIDELVTTGLYGAYILEL